MGLCKNCSIRAARRRRIELPLYIQAGIILKDCGITVYILHFLQAVRSRRRVPYPTVATVEHSTSCCSAPEDRTVSIHTSWNKIEKIVASSIHPTFFAVFALHTAHSRVPCPTVAAVEPQHFVLLVAGG